MSENFLPVPFHRDTVYLAEHEGQPVAPLRPIVENLGLNWPSQFKKLNSARHRWGVVMITTPSTGGPQEALCIPVRKLPAFLFSIEPRKVRPAIRPKLEQYQAECDDVLWQYWNQRVGKPQAALPAPEPDTVSIPKDEYIALLKAESELLRARLQIAVSLPALPGQAKTRRRSPSLTLREVAEMRRLAARGVSPYRIASALHRSRDAVTKVLRAGAR